MVMMLMVMMMMMHWHLDFLKVLMESSVQGLHCTTTLRTLLCKGNLCIWLWSSYMIIMIINIYDDHDNQGLWSSWLSTYMVIISSSYMIIMGGTIIIIIINTVATDIIIMMMMMTMHIIPIDRWCHQYWDWHSVDGTGYPFLASKLSPSSLSPSSSLSSPSLSLSSSSWSWSSWSSTLSLSSSPYSSSSSSKSLWLPSLTFS